MNLHMHIFNMNTNILRAHYCLSSRLFNYIVAFREIKEEESWSISFRDASQSRCPIPNFPSSIRPCSTEMENIRRAIIHGQQNLTRQKIMKLEITINSIMWSWWMATAVNPKLKTIFCNAHLYAMSFGSSPKICKPCLCKLYAEYIRDSL